MGPTSGAEFWAKTAVFCRLVEDDGSGAQLGLDLMREAGQTDDDAFFELATAIAGRSEPPPLPTLTEPAAIHVALLSLAEWPLPEALADAAPPVLAAVARAGAGRRPPMAVLEQAFLVGATPADRVAASYAEVTPTAADALPSPESDWDAPSARHGLRRRAQRGRSGGPRRVAGCGLARIERCRTLPGRRGARGAVRRAAGRAPAREGGAEHGAGAACGRSAGACGQLAVSAHRAVGTGRTLAACVAGLVPLFALAGVGGSDAVPRIDAAAIEAWQLAATADAATTERLFVLLEGVGAPWKRPWRDLLPAHAQRQAAAPARRSGVAWSAPRPSARSARPSFTCCTC